MKAKRLISLFALIFLNIGFLWSQKVDPVLFTAEVVPQMIGISEKGVLEITGVIASHYTINDTTNGLFYVIPQALKGIRFDEVEYPRGEQRALEKVYKNNIKVKIPFAVGKEVSEGNQVICVDVTFQACSEDGGICYLPKTQNLKSEFTVLLSQLENQTYSEKESGISGRLSRALEGGSAISFLLVFLGGILTSLTPCVYPMIPITIAIIGAQTVGGKFRGFVLSLFYVFGIAVTFSVLGILAAKTGTLFGSYTQHPFVIIVIAVVFFLMGLSLLGVFVLQIPPVLASKLRGKKKGLMGALITGLFAGLIVSPCISPILVVMLTWVAKTGSIFLGFGLLFSFAMGLGVLFILIGAFSGVVKNLPKSGGWMVIIERILGIFLIILSLIYLKSLLSDLIYFCLWALFMIILGTFIGAFVPLKSGADWKKKMEKAFGILLIVAGGCLVFYIFFRSYDLGIIFSRHAVPSIQERDFWFSSDGEGFQQAQLEGKPVVMDFYADWCSACRELDEKSWSDNEVYQELTKFICVKLDLTKNDEMSKVYQKKYQIIGMPTVIFFRPSGEEMGRFEGFKSPEQVLEYLQRYRTL